MSLAHKYLKMLMISEIKDSMGDDYEKYKVESIINEYFENNDIFETDVVCQNSYYRDRSLYKESCKRCMARVWNDGFGGQCSRNKKENSDYCGKHMKMALSNKLQCGRIDEEKPLFIKIMVKGEEVRKYWN